MAKIQQENSKEIIVLNDFEAIRLRPSLYVGAITETEDKLPIIINNKLTLTDKTWSPGFFQLFIEIVENAIDEAKRCKGKMEKIKVSINLDNNMISVQDTGNGFYNGHKIHTKSKKNVVRTALEELHAGSNFGDTESNILGTFGLGAAVTNILSEKFEITTINSTHYVHFKWEDFKLKEEVIREKTSKEHLGTNISFIPSKEMYPIQSWDKDLIMTYFSLKSFLIKNDPNINSLKLIVTFTEQNIITEIPLYENFFSDNMIKVDTKLGSIFLWESYKDSCSVSFINGSQCVGIHQKIVNDWCNEYFKFEKAHHYYETMVMLNFPSTLMRFADQNKTKYAVSRYEIEDDMNIFKSKLIKLLDKSDIARNVEQKIEERLHNENISKIRKAGKVNKRKVSDKYSPAQTKDNLLLTEGLSAAGAAKQARDIRVDSVYALRGKVKNTRRLSDLTSNKEILELMTILEIEPGRTKVTPFKKIIIATDEDVDGHFIAALLINFFTKWFPEIVKDGKLFKIVTPLVACNVDKTRKYFYTLGEYSEFIKTHKVTSVMYLKGLGSLEMNDWEYVMGNRTLKQITYDCQTDKSLEMAFGDKAALRKKWLMQ